jgi:hypothetical protein
MKTVWKMNKFFILSHFFLFKPSHRNTWRVLVKLTFKDIYSFARTTSNFKCRHAWTLLTARLWEKSMCANNPINMNCTEIFISMFFTFTFYFFANFFSETFLLCALFFSSPALLNK